MVIFCVIIVVNYRLFAILLRLVLIDQELAAIVNSGATQLKAGVAVRLC